MDKLACFARFTQALEYLENERIIVSQVELAKILDVSESVLSSARKNKDRRFSKPFVKKFASAFADYINEGWLLTGEGQMEVLGKNMRPHFDAKVSAGFMDGLSEGKMSAEFRAMTAGVNPYDFTIDVQGDSMLPRIENGDTLMCCKSLDRLNPPIGKICVIDTKDGPVVKIIEKVDEDRMTLHSLNPDYHDYDIDVSTINGIAVVTGLIRNFE